MSFRTLLKQTYVEWSADKGPRLGAALAYYAIFSIPPLMMITIAVVHIIYPGDIVARLLSDRLAKALGQSVVVENRAGASGAIGTQGVAVAAPDGHTLLVGQTAEVAINHHLFKGLGYDPDRDLQPIALVVVVPNAV